MRSEVYTVVCACVCMCVCVYSRLSVTLETVTFGRNSEVAAFQK